MKISRDSECSLSSDQSNILSLSSNRSQIAKKQEVNELQRLRQKLFRLFGVQSDDIEQLYLAMSSKFSKNYVKHTVDELNQMLQHLEKAKRNNREMAKLVSSLGIKFHEKQTHKHPKKQNPNQNICSTSKRIETNQASTSYQEYNFQYHPIKPIFNLESIQFHGADSYEMHRLNSKKYEQKIIRMLDDLGKIKNSLEGAKLEATKPMKSIQRNNSNSELQTEIYLQKQQSKIQESENHKIARATSSQHELEKSLLTNVQDQKSLCIKANQISKRLEEIKSKILSFKTSQKNIPELSSQKNPQSSQIKLKEEKCLSLSKNIIHSQQKSVRFESLSNSSSQNKLSMVSEERKFPVKEKLTKKKSILDEMKNVQSKMIISEKQIHDQQTLIDVFNGLVTDQKIKNVSSKGDIFHPYLEPGISQQNLGQKQAVKQVVISYSTMQKSNPKNRSFHNTSIMNPHYVSNQTKVEEKPKHQKDNIRNRSLEFELINRTRNNETRQEQEFINYSKENKIKDVKYRSSLPLISDIRSTQKIDYSHSAINISLQNLNNRLIHPLKQQVHTSKQQFLRQVHPARYIHTIIPINGQKLSHFNTRSSQRIEPRMINPFENISQQIQQRNNSSQLNPFIHKQIQPSNRNNSVYKPSIKFTQPNQGKSYQTSGINLSVIKGTSDSSFKVTLGRSNQQMRESSYSRDSKKGRGVRLSNQFA